MPSNGSLSCVLTFLIKGNPDKIGILYYGFYNNVSRGRRKKQDQDDIIPSILESDGSSKAYRKNWARLIQKIYEVDPLTCARCGGAMGVLSFIEDPEIIKKILKHLDLLDVKPRPPPKATGSPKTAEYSIDYATSQLLASDKWLYIEPEYPEAYPA